MPGFMSGVKGGMTGGIAGGGSDGDAMGRALGKLGNLFRKKPKDDTGDDGFYGSDVTSYHKGGVVRKTGLARLKKGERVLTKSQFKRIRGK